MQTMSLWDSHVQEGDPAAREMLLNEHLGLVHHVARQMHRKLAVDADFDELVSAGTFGLMNALDNFDPGRGLAFSTFAAPRIRGAMLDELRRQDHVPRSIRRKTRDITAARDVLMRRHGREPEERELAEHLDIDLKTFWRWQAEIEGVFHLSIDRSVGYSEVPRSSPIELLASDDENEIEDRLNLEQEAGLLREAILGLKEQERLVLSLYYYEELKLHEIATILRLTESRVSQIRAKAVARLREEMAPLREMVA